MKFSIHDIALAALTFMVAAVTQLSATGLSMNSVAITSAITAGVTAVVHKFYPGAK